MAERIDPFLPDDTIPGTDAIDPVQIAEAMPQRPVPPIPPVRPSQSTLPPVDQPLDKFVLPEGFQMPEAIPQRVPQLRGRERSLSKTPPPLLSPDQFNKSVDDFKKAIGFEEDPGSDVGRNRTTIGALGQGFLQGLGSDVPKGIGIVQGHLSGEDPSKTKAFQIGEDIEKWMERTLPTNPKYRSDMFTYIIPNAIGQGAGTILSFMTGVGAVGFGARAVGVTGRVASTALKVGGVVASSPANFASMAVDGFQDAVKHGAKLEDAFSSFYANGALGLTEFIPITRALGRADDASGGMVSRSLSRFLSNAKARQAAEAGLDEFVQEFVQQIGQNLIASDLVKYDPKRQMFEGAPEAGIAGFSVGSLYGLLFAMLPGRQRVYQATPQNNGGPNATGPTNPQLPPPNNGPTPGPTTPPGLGPAPGPDGNAPKYFELPPPPSNNVFLSDQIGRLSRVDEEMKAADPTYLGDTNIGETIQFFRYLEKSERDFERLRSMDPVTRKLPQNELLAQEVVANRELVELLKDPIRMVSRPTYVLQEAGTSRTPGKVIQLEVDAEGNPIYKRDGKWVRMANGKDRAVGKGKVIRLDSTNPENLALSPIGQRMIREARARQLAEQGRAQEAMDTAAGQRGDQRSARTPASTGNGPKMLDKPVQMRPDSAPGPMQSVEDAAMSAAGDNQTAARERAKAETSALLQSAGASQRMPGVFIEFTALPGDMQTRIAARNLMLGRPTPDILDKQDLLDANIPEATINSMFSRRDTAARIEARNPSSDDRAARWFSQQYKAPLTGKGPAAILRLLPHSGKHTQRLLNNILRAWQRNLGTKLNAVNVIDFTAWMKNDPNLIYKMGARGDETAAFLPYLVKSLDKLISRVENSGIALAQSKPDTFIRDVAHELTHLLVHVNGMSQEALGDLWQKLSEDAANGKLDPKTEKLFNDVSKNYSDARMTDDVRGEEFLAYSVENFLVGRYATKEDLRAKTGEAYSWADKVHDFITKLYHFVRDAFEGVVKKDVINGFLKNIETAYGVNFLDPIPDATPSKTAEQIDAHFSRRVNPEISPFFSPLVRHIETAMESGAMPMSGFAGDYANLLDNWAKQGLVSKEELTWTRIDGEQSITDYLRSNPQQRFSAATLLTYIKANTPDIRTTEPFLSRATTPRAPVDPRDGASEAGEVDFQHDHDIEPDLHTVAEIADEHYLDEAQDEIFEQEDSALNDAKTLALEMLGFDALKPIFSAMKSEVMAPVDRVENLSSNKNDFEDMSNILSDMKQVLSAANDAKAGEVVEAGSIHREFTMTQELHDILHFKLPTALQIEGTRTLDPNRWRNHKQVRLEDLTFANPVSMLKELTDAAEAIKSEVETLMNSPSNITSEDPVKQVRISEVDPVEFGKFLFDLVDHHHTEVDDAIVDNDDRASELARERAYENERDNSASVYMDRTHGYRIEGNTDMGYTVYTPDGGFLTETNSMRQAERAAQEDANERFGTPEEPSDEAIAEYEAELVRYQRAINSPDNVVRGPKWSQYVPYSLPAGALFDYQDTLFKYDHPTIPDDKKFTNANHFSEVDKNVVLFLRHAGVRLDRTAFNIPGEGMVELEASFEAQSDYAKGDAMSRAAQRRMDEIMAIQNKMGDNLYARMTEVFSAEDIPYTDITDWRAAMMPQLAEDVDELIGNAKNYPETTGANYITEVMHFDPIDAGSKLEAAKILAVLDISPVTILSKYGPDIYRRLFDLRTAQAAYYSEMETLRVERRKLAKFTSAKVGPAPYIGSEYDKIAASWVPLAARYHLWTAVKEGRDGMLLASGEAVANQWSRETFKNISVEFRDNALITDRNSPEMIAARVRRREEHLKFDNPTFSEHMQERDYPPGSGDAARKDWEQQHMYPENAAPILVKMWNKNFNVKEFTVSNLEDLSHLVGGDIYALLKKNGLMSGEPVHLRAGVDIAQTYFTPGSKQDSNSGYRTIYDKMYPDAIREIYKKMGWGTPVFHNIQIDGKSAKVLLISDQVRKFFASRGDQSIPLFGARFARRPAVSTNPDTNIENDPTFDQVAGVGMLRFARRTKDVAFPAPGVEFSENEDPNPKTNIARGRAAMKAIAEAAASEKNSFARIKQAMYRKAIGWIGFFGGDLSKGLSHVSRRPERKDLTTRIPEIIAEGVIGPNYLMPPASKAFYSLRRNIVRNNEVVVIAPTFDNEASPWVVTARPASQNVDDQMFNRSAGGVPISDRQAAELSDYLFSGDREKFAALAQRIVTEAGNTDMIVDNPITDVKFSRRTNPVVAAPTYSGLYRSIERADRKSAPAGVWQAWVKEAQRKGVTEAEIKWSGLREWLASRKGPISREDVLGFLRRTEIKVSEVSLGRAAANEEAYTYRKRELEASIQIRDGVATNLINQYFPQHAEQAKAWYDYYAMNDSTDADDPGGRTMLRDSNSRMLDRLETLAEERRTLEEKLLDLEDQWDLANQGIVSSDNQYLVSGTNSRWGLDDYAGEILEVPGNREDYRELVFTWRPTLEDGITVDQDKNGKWSVFGAGMTMSGFDSEEAARSYAVGIIPHFKSLHWDGINNPIMHVRFNTRVDTDGNRVLFVEEIQSDWHNRGRAAGYATPDRIERAYEAQNKAKSDLSFMSAEFKRKLEAASEYFRNQYVTGSEYGSLNKEDWVERWFQIDRANDLHPDTVARIKGELDLASVDAAMPPKMQMILAAQWLTYGPEGFGKRDDILRANLAKANKEVDAAVRHAPPPAPFDKGDADTVSLVAKRLVRYAADNGFNRIAWTSGKAQATRYNLDLHVGSITYRPTAPGADTYRIIATDPQQKKISLTQLEQHGIDPRAMTIQNIADTFGAPIASKISKNEGRDTGTDAGRVLTGVDLKVDDKPKRDLYDNVVPNVFLKVVKTFDKGAKIVKSTIETEAMYRNNASWPGGAHTFEGVEITPEITDSAIDLGFARFARRGPGMPPPPPTGPVQTTPGQPGQTWFQRMVDWIGRHDPIFTQSSQRIRAVGGTRTAYELGNEFRRDIHARVAPGTKGVIGEDYHGVIQGALGKFLPRLGDLLSGIPESARMVLADVMRGTYLNPQTGRITIPANSGLTAQQAQEFRAYLNDVLNFANEHMQGLSSFGIGKGVKHVTANDLIGKLANYFPQQWRIEGTFGSEVPNLKGLDREAAAMEFFKAAGIYSGSPNPTEMIREMMNNIMGLYGFVSYASSSVGNIGSAYHLSDSTLKRVLNIDPTKVFKITVNGQQHDVKLSDFLDNDPAHVLLNYTTSMIRHAEWVRRFGPKGEAIDTAMNQIDAERKASGRNAMTPEEQAIIVNAIQSNVGGLKRPGRLFDTTSQWVQVAGNAIYLSMSVLASVPELIMPAVRVGMTGQLYAYRAGLRSIFKWSGVSKDRQFARELGIMHEEAHNALQNSVIDYGDFSIQKWNQRIFQAIGLNIFTRLTQTMGAAAGRFALPGWAKHAAAGSTKHQRWLREVGLTHHDLVNYNPETYMPGSNVKIDAAIRQMVSEIVINPTHAGKAAWMNDPRFRLVAHIKSYMWGFNNTVLQRVGGEIMHGNMMPLIFLMATVALAGAISDLREWLVYGEEGNPALQKLREKGSPEAMWLYNAADRGGLFGPLTPLFNMMTNTRAGSSGTWTGTLVPAVGIVDNVLKTTKGLANYSVTNDPADLRMAVDGATRLVPGAIWTGSSVLTGANRNDVLDALAPKKAPGGGGTAKTNIRGGATGR